MQRIPFADERNHSGEVRAALGALPVNVTRMLAVASEPVFHAVSRVGSAFINGSSLPPKLRELAILRVGYLSESRYETFQHEALGRHVGLADGQIEAIRSGDIVSGALDAEAVAVLLFVDDVVRNVRAGDGTLSAVRHFLDDTQVVDLIMVTGFYMLICRVLETSGIGLDAEPIDWNTIAKPR